MISDTSSIHQNPKTDSIRSPRVTLLFGTRAVGQTCRKTKAYTSFVGSWNFCFEREQLYCRSRLAAGHRERIAPLYDNVLSNVFRSPELSSLNGHSFGTGTLHEAYHSCQSSADQVSLKVSTKHIQSQSSYCMPGKRMKSGYNLKYWGLQRLQQLNLVFCAMHTAHHRSQLKPGLKNKYAIRSKHTSSASEKLRVTDTAG